MRRSVELLILVVMALGWCWCASAAAAGARLTPAVGVVVAAQGAQVSQVAAMDGASLYVGDTLATDAAGSLRVRFGSSMLMLGPGTVVKLAEASSGVAAVLQHGLVRFSKSGSPMELRVLSAIVHPREGASGEVVIVGPQEFQIGCTKGDIDVDIDGVDRVVSEATAYDVTLESDPDNSKSKAIRKQKGLWIPIALVALLTALALTAVSLSSSKF